MVGRHSLKTRFLALFVTVFVCLNGAGAACVAYCQTMDEPAETVDHCPLKKLAEDCDSDRPAFSAHDGEFDCCPMTVSFFAAPVEKPTFSFKQPVASLIVTPEVYRTEFQAFTPLLSSISYRGPPPRDRRIDRIKHRVLLI